MSEANHHKVIASRERNHRNLNAHPGSRPEGGALHEQLGWNSRHRTSAPGALPQPHSGVQSRSLTLSQPSSPNFKNKSTFLPPGAAGAERSQKPFESYG